MVKYKLILNAASVSMCFLIIVHSSEFDFSQDEH